MKKKKTIANSNSNISFHFLVLRVGRNSEGEVVSVHPFVEYTCS